MANIRKVLAFPTPGLADTLLRAILEHRGLRSLAISYRGRTRRAVLIPYLSASTVGALVDGLPRLQGFEFAPERGQMVSNDPLFLICSLLPNSIVNIDRLNQDEIGQSLAPKLPASTSITRFPSPELGNVTRHPPIPA